MKIIKEEYTNLGFENVDELIDWLTNHKFAEKEEIDATTDDGYDYWLWWSNPTINVFPYPIIQIDFNGEVIFHREGPELPTEIDYKMFVNKSIKFLENRNDKMRIIKEDRKALKESNFNQYRFKFHYTNGYEPTFVIVSDSLIHAWLELFHSVPGDQIGNDSCYLDGIELVGMSF